MNIGISLGHTLIGADSGAVHKNYKETDLNRELGSLVKTKLQAHGHKVYYVYNDSASIVNDSIQYRVNRLNSFNLDLIIELHFNAGGGRGFESYIVGKGGNAEKYGKMINEALEKGTVLKNRGVKVANFKILRDTTAPCILLEVAFLDSADMEIYNKVSVAEAITKALTPNYNTGSNKLYKVQVGAYKDRSNAEATLNKLLSLGIEGYIKEE